MQYEGRTWRYGDDINTDVLIPARYLNTSDPAELAKHALEDLDADFVKNVQTGDIIVGGKNFGCGSSREHAPQGLARHGIKAIVGESFSEIFLGNSAVLGIPCFTADKDAVESLQATIEADPETVVEANVESGLVTAGTLEIQASVAPGLRDAFLSDQWNPTAMLLDDFEQVNTVASRLPYISGF